MELRILVYLAALLLFLSIVRPLIRGLWKLSGLTACPLLALGIMAGIFPAYGFRPECIPLLLCAVSLAAANFGDLAALFSSLHGDAYRDRGLLFTLSSAAVFACTLWIALYFAPPLNTDLGTEGVKTLFLQGGKLHVRIYGPVDQEPDQSLPSRPLLIFLPPAAGSLTVTDEVCGALRDRGFTVLACSRLNFDSPAFDGDGMPVRLHIPDLFRLTNALTGGMRNTIANAGGRELEESRKQDTIYLLEELPRNKILADVLGGTEDVPVFLAGYGAGGAALTVLAGQDDFTLRFQNIRGIIAVEAPLLSSLEGDPLPPLPPPPKNRIGAFIYHAEEFAESLVPRKITRIGTIPRPAVPILFILSDRVIHERSGRYETILRTLVASRNTAMVAAVPGAGPLDYSGSPRYYPLLSFLFRGAYQTGRAETRNWPELTASLMANFAALVLETETADTDEVVSESSLTKTALDRTIHLEIGGVWKIPGIRTILQP
jgi:hypothetical protein